MDGLLAERSAAWVHTAVTEGTRPQGAAWSTGVARPGAIRCARQRLGGDPLRGLPGLPAGSCEGEPEHAPEERCEHHRTGASRQRAGEVDVLDPGDARVR